SDVVRLGVAAFIVVITALSADRVVRLEKLAFDLAASLPSWVHGVAETVYRIGTVGTVVVLALAFAFTKKFRLLLLLAVAGALGYVASLGLAPLIDATPARAAAGVVHDGVTPEYPIVVLGAATTVLLVAAPYLLRPARRLMFAALTLGVLGALGAVVGTTEDVIGSVALAWGVAALVH